MIQLCVEEYLWTIRKTEAEDVVSPFISLRVYTSQQFICKCNF